MLLFTFIWLLYLIAISDSHIIPKSIDNDYNLNAVLNELNDLEELVDGNNVASYKASELETNIEKPKEIHERETSHKTTKLKTTALPESTNLSIKTTTMKKTHFWNRILPNFKKNHKKTTLLFKVRDMKPLQNFDSISDYIYYDFRRPKRQLNKTKKIHCNRINKLKSLKIAEAADASSSDQMMTDLIAVKKTTTLNKNINKASDPDLEINSSKVTMKTFEPTTSAKIAKTEKATEIVDELISTEANDFNTQLSTIINKYSTYSKADTTENEYLGTMELEPILNRIKNDTIRFINKINPAANAKDMYVMSSPTEVPEYALSTLITLTNGRHNDVLGIELANIITVSPVLHHTARSVDKQIVTKKSEVKSMYNKYYKKLSDDFKCEAKELKAILSGILKNTLHKNIKNNENKKNLTKTKTVATEKEHKTTSTPKKNRESKKAYSTSQNFPTNSLNPVLRVHNVPSENSNYKESNEQIDRDNLMLRSFERMLSNSPKSNLELYETARPVRLSKRDDKYHTSLPSEVLDYVEANKNNDDDNRKSEEFENLMKRLSYNEYVNGYRHFLNFEKELGAENFSNAIKFQAHLHHKVDDIGKFILTKLPDSSEFQHPKEAPARIKRHIDHTDSVDQNVSSMIEDSWFKKHFAKFSEKKSPKKFHTFQMVELKTPSDSAVHTADTQVTRQQIVGNAGDAKVKDNVDKNLDQLTTWPYSLTSSSPYTYDASGALKPKRSEQKQEWNRSKRSVKNVGNDKIPVIFKGNKGNTKSLSADARYPTEVVNLIKGKTTTIPNLYHRMLKKFRSRKHKKSKQNHAKFKRHSVINFSLLKKLNEMFVANEVSTSDPESVNNTTPSLSNILHGLPNITQETYKEPSKAADDKLSAPQDTKLLDYLINNLPRIDDSLENKFLKTDEKSDVKKYSTKYGMQRYPKKSDLAVKKYSSTSKNPLSENPTGNTLETLPYGTYSETGTAEARQWMPRLGFNYMFTPKFIDDRIHTVSCKKCHNKRNVKDVTENRDEKYLTTLPSITQITATESYAIVKPKTVTKFEETTKKDNEFKRILKKLKSIKIVKRKVPISKRLAERNPRFNPLKMLKEMFGGTNRRNYSDTAFPVDNRQDLIKSFKLFNVPSIRAMMQQIPNITQDVEPANHWQPSGSYENDKPEIEEKETPEFHSQISEIKRKKTPKYRTKSYTLKSRKTLHPFTLTSEKFFQWKPMVTKPSPFFYDLHTVNSNMDISEKTSTEKDEHMKNILLIPDNLSWKQESNYNNKVRTFYDKVEKNMLNLENDLKKYSTKSEIPNKSLKFRTTFINYPTRAENLRINQPTKFPLYYTLVEAENSLKKLPLKFEVEEQTVIPKQESNKETSVFSKIDDYGDLSIMDNDVLSGDEKTVEEFMKNFRDFFASSTPDKEGLEEEVKSIKKFVSSTTNSRTKSRPNDVYSSDYSKLSLVELVTPSTSSRKNKGTRKVILRNDHLDYSGNKVLKRITASDQAMVMAPAKNDVHQSKPTRVSHPGFGYEEEHTEIPKKESSKEISDVAKTDYYGDLRIMENDVLSSDEKTVDEFMKSWSDFFASNTPDKAGLEEEAKSIKNIVGSTTNSKTKSWPKHVYSSNYSKLVEWVTPSTSSHKNKETRKMFLRNDHLDDSGNKVLTRITASDQVMVMAPAKNDEHQSKPTRERHSGFGYEATNKVLLKPDVTGDDNYFAYDDASLMNDKEDHERKISRSSQNSGNKIKAQLSKKTTKINTRPVQFFSTPLPMNRPEFEKFLRENKMDVLSVTSPLPDLDTLRKTAKCMTHKFVEELKKEKTEIWNKVKTIKPKGEKKGKAKEKHRRLSEDVMNTNYTPELKKHEVNNHSNKKKDTVKKIYTNGKKQKKSPKKLKNKNMKETENESNLEDQIESVNELKKYINMKILESNNKNPIHRNYLDSMPIDYNMDDLTAKVAVDESKSDKNRHVLQTHLNKMRKRPEKRTTKDWSSLSSLQDLLLSKKSQYYNYNYGHEHRNQSLHTHIHAEPTTHAILKKNRANQTMWIKLVFYPQEKKPIGYDRPARLMGMPRHNAILRSGKPYRHRSSCNERHQRDNHKGVFSEPQAETIDIRYGDGSNLGELKDNILPASSKIPSTVYYYKVKEPKVRKLMRIFVRSQRTPTLRFFQAPEHRWMHFISKLNRSDIFKKDYTKVTVPMKKPEKHKSQKWSRASTKSPAVDDDGLSKDIVQPEFHLSNEDIEDHKLHDPGYYGGLREMHYNPVFIEFTRKNKIPNEAAKSKDPFQVPYVVSRDRRDTDVKYQVEVVLDLVKLNNSNIELARLNENHTNFVVHFTLAIPLNILENSNKKKITTKPMKSFHIEKNCDAKSYHANNGDDTPSMYVMMEKKYSGDLESRHIESSDAIPTVVNTINPPTNDVVNVTLSKEFISALNEQVSQIIGNFKIANSTNAMVKTRGYIDDVKKAIIDALKQEIVKVNNPQARERIEKKTKRYAQNKDKNTRRVWDSIKKYFGHEHVCRCKCKANTTMCPMCAHIDNVIRELIFEFDFISDYMKEHCTEIQTFFWQNPTGGKKLRNTVKCIDNNLNDYFKRVCGKCKGKNCDKFLSYPEKRSYNIEKYDSKTLQKKLDNLSSCLKKAIHDRICLCKFMKIKSNDLVELVDTFSRINKKLDMRSAILSQSENTNAIYAVKKILVNIISDNKARNTTSKTSYLTEISTQKSTTLHTGLHLDTNIDDIILKYDLNSIVNQKYIPLQPKSKLQILKDAILKLHQIKRSAKREVKTDETQIENPLISDAEGFFWSDYINKGRDQTVPDSNRLARQFNNKPDKSVEEDDAKMYARLVDPVPVTATESKNNVLNTKSLFVLKVDHQTQSRNSCSELLKVLKEYFASKMPLSLFIAKNRNTKQNKTTKTVIITPNIPNTVHVTNYTIMVEHPMTSVVSTKDLSLTTQSTKSIHKTVTTSPLKTNKKIEKPTVITKTMTKSTFGTKTYTKTTSNANKTTKTKLATYNRDKETNLKKTKVYDNDSVKNKHNNRFYKLYTMLATYCRSSCHPRGQFVTTTTKITKPINQEDSVTDGHNNIHTEKYETEVHEDEKSGSSSLSDLNKESLRDLEMKLEVMKENNKKEFQTFSTFEKAIDEDNLTGGKDGHTQGEATKSVLVNKDLGVTKQDLEDTAELSTMSMKPDNWSILRYLNTATSRHQSTTTPMSLLAAAIINLKRVTRRKTNSSKSVEKKAVKMENKKFTENFKDVLKNKLFRTLKRTSSVIPNSAPEAQAKPKETFTSKRSLQGSTALQDRSKEVFDAIATTNNSICDLQVTLDKIVSTQSKIAAKKFEKYARNVSCLKNKTVPEVFNIALDTSRIQYPKMRWDWIRNKRSLLSIDDFDVYYRGRDGVYRWKVNRRRKRTLNRKELYDGFRNLPKIVDGATNIYAMAGDTVTLYCNPSTLFQKQPFTYWRRSYPYNWTTERADMLNYDNVKVKYDALVLNNVTARNVGVYNCSKGLNLRRRVKLSVLSVPEFGFAFGLAYNAGSDCNYDHLTAFRSGLPEQMAQHACSQGRLCTITLDDLACLKDLETGNSTIRGTAVLTPPAVTADIDCSPLCRRDILCTLAVLSADNLPVLASIPVELSDGINKRILPAVTTYSSNSIVTHTLRRKDSNHQRESQQMSAVKAPGDMHVTVSCPAGQYLQTNLKICEVCPMNTFAGYGSNICSACLPGTRTRAPGSAVCRYPAGRQRRYDWVSASYGSYAVAAAAVACVCVVGAVCGACGACAARGGHKERGEAAMTSVLTARHSPRPAARAARPPDPLSPSRVLLTKFFKDLDWRDSQVTRLEVCKEENSPPPLPPVDFD